MLGPNKVNIMLRLDLSLSSMVVKVKRNNGLSYDKIETKHFPEESGHTLTRFIKLLFFLT